MEKVKNCIIETIIQINRTHYASAYGLLLKWDQEEQENPDRLCGGGRIWKPPWTTLI